ncbi:MAG: hypothetical protein H5T69_00645 [Chloroflexi bacterium]|nr:hypothetical protein [Chloroflexota bacterium]
MINEWVGKPVDVAPWGQPRWWTGTQGRDVQAHPLGCDPAGALQAERDPDSGAWQVGLEWDNPRDVARVVLVFAGALQKGVRLQYWRHHWPQVAPERRPGARRGWLGVDDPYHGHWVTMRGEAYVEGNVFSFLPDAIDLPELGREAAEALEQAADYRARFRRTLKLRALIEGQARPSLVAIHAYSPSIWHKREVLVQFGVDGRAEGRDWSGTLSVYDGLLCSLEPLPESAERLRMTAANGWQVVAPDGPLGLRLELLQAVGSPMDRTIVTVHTGAAGFSFLVDDLDSGPIYVTPYDAWIRSGEHQIEWPAFKRQLGGMPLPIHERVSQEPEQSLARAMAEIPALDVTKQEPYGRYLPLSLDEGRQEWALRYNGELFADKAALKLSGRDGRDLDWPGTLLRFRFGSGDPPDFREGRDVTRQRLLDGWLPVVISSWRDREIEYEQTVFVAPLDGPMLPPEQRHGDEPIVALMRFRLRNTTHYPKVAQLWLAVSPQEELVWREGLLLARGRVVPAEPVQRQWRIQPYGRAYLRCALVGQARGCWQLTAHPSAPGGSLATPGALLYSIELDGYETDTVTFAFPFVGLSEPDVWGRLSALDYDALLADVGAYWRAYGQSGGQFDLPEGLLNDLARAARVHVAISADKDPASELTVVPAATWNYGACGNEACWQITMLDQAGYHERAARYLETFLHTQGLKPLDGDFASAEGALMGLDLDAGEPQWSHFAYNLDHGVIMECLADHYRYSGDRAWLARVAPHLAAACELVARERRRTRRQGPDGRPDAAWGLLPAGHLEDNREWRHWFAVNAHAYNGMRRLAECLAEIGHPAAEGLLREAAAYREDIRTAARRAMIEAPVVRLLDGTYIPHIPTRTHLRGREWGWFREAAYGAAHLMEGDVFDPNEPEMTWVLQDLEDNLFVHRQYGRPVDVEKEWFSLGGVTIQPNLMDLGIDYLRRGEIEQALRALFNNLGVSLYPDVRCFTEHPVIEPGHGVGPFYKSSDEAKALIWLRHFLLHEEGKTLHLALGAPRAWFAPGERFGLHRMASYFGPISLGIESSADVISTQITLAPERLPEKVALHLRHPRRWPIASVTLNGRPWPLWDNETVWIPDPPAEIVVNVRYEAVAGSIPASESSQGSFIS